MKILLAPSERKTVGGDFPPSQKLLLFLKRFIKKEYTIKKYDEFLKKTDDIKNFGEDKTSIFSKNTKKAILRYSGVAFEHLNYKNLDNNSKQ